MEKNTQRVAVPHHVALLSGAFAGLSVDITLFPLDTLKTRLQSERGLFKSGGFHRLWAGIGPVFVGSAPGAATFFLAYEAGKSSLFPGVTSDPIVTHMLSAALGEVCACVIRVPTEVVKQRMQVSAKGTASLGVLKSAVKAEGVFGLFRGYRTTVMREVPFSLIQMPLWEWMKTTWASKSQAKQITPIQSALCGALAGGFSAALTTPLDVVKTRIMLADSNSQLAKSQSVLLALRMVLQERGFSGLFSGIVPRVAWISIGGALFLGVYDLSVTVLA